MGRKIYSPSKNIVTQKPDKLYRCSVHRCNDKKEIGQFLGWVVYKDDRFTYKFNDVHIDIKELQELTELLKILNQ